MGKRTAFAWLVFLISASVWADEPIVLRQGWQLRTSAGMNATGAELSSLAFSAGSDWTPAVVPGTVVGSLVKSGAFADPLVGMNMRALPGTSYPIGDKFGHYEMPKDSPFRVPWWYRVKFHLPDSAKGKIIWLELDGISYKADVWLNGTKLGSSDQLVGTFRRFQLNATAAALPGADNELALSIVPPTRDSLSLTFVDWNPGPPDKSMGIWRDITVVTTGPVRLTYPQVATDRLDSDGAELSVNAILRNGSDQVTQGTLEGMIDGVIKFSQDLTLQPGEQREAHFDASQFPQLKMPNPRLWWPVGMGSPNLYVMDLRFRQASTVSDTTQMTFGVRKVESELDPTGSRLFKVNGKRVYVHGAAWTPEIFLNYLPNRTRAGLEYAKDIGLNTVRLEGKLESDIFYDLADREGLLVLSGINCCDYWEHSSKYPASDRKIARDSVRDIILRIRSHASAFDWLNGSDDASSAEMEREYIDALTEARWPNPYQASASDQVSHPGDHTGVKMTGPYNYVAPNYWIRAKTLGGAFGFNTETSPGESIPPIESLKKFIPEDHLWPLDAVWKYHTAGFPYDTLFWFTEALHHRFGPTRSLEEYAMKSQVLAYEGHRAMFEAYLENKHIASTGIIQWMMTSAWPSLEWNLFDYYLRPGGAYFGAKSANEPVHVQYSLQDRSVVLANQTYGDFPGVTVTADVYDFRMNKVYSKSQSAHLEADAVLKTFQLPKRYGAGRTYFLRLTLTDSAGGELSRNFYWLSHRKEIPGPWELPTLQFADYRQLDELPKVDLQVTTSSHKDGAKIVRVVTVTNPSKSLAFSIRLKTDDASGEEILPVLWQDNYFSLLPGETRTLQAHYSGPGDQERVEWSGWNVTPGMVQ